MLDRPRTDFNEIRKGRGILKGKKINFGCNNAREALETFAALTNSI